MVELVSVNDTVVAAAKAAAFIVIVPHNLLSVTLVDLLVAWVTVPPFPVVYPIPPPLDVIAPVTARLVPVAAPITGVVSDTDGLIAVVIAVAPLPVTSPESVTV